MAALDAVAADRLGMVAPDREHIVAAALRAALAPQHEKLRGQLAAAIAAVVPGDGEAIARIVST